jgi:5-deoxy-glucuronate isomerase
VQPFSGQTWRGGYFTLERQKMTTSTQLLSLDSCVIRNTGAGKGRTMAVAPGETASRHLYFGRIILEGGAEPLKFETEMRETGLVCLKGSASISTEGRPYTLNRYDALYVPRNASVEVKPGAAGCDLAEISAQVENRYPVQYVSFAEVQTNPNLHFKAGGAGAERSLNILIGNNVQGGRILAGVTFSAPGNWTSWPPHEHAEILEEAYLYIDMPTPSFGLQLVYTKLEEPELAVIVRQDDCVLMPAGYHPNVAAPGGSINFLWMMAANREVEDRKFGVVNVQPEFAQGGSGLEAGQAKA